MPGLPVARMRNHTVDKCFAWQLAIAHDFQVLSSQHAHILCQALDSTVAQATIITS